MALGCDSGIDDFTAARVQTLKNAGMEFVCAYINYSDGYHGQLSATEAKRIIDAGMYVVSLYESYYAAILSHYTKEHGAADAKEAVEYAANELHQPKGTPIYFAVEMEATREQTLNYVVPYFQGIIPVVENAGYKLGVYGSIPVCKYIRGNYAATTRYTMITDNGWVGDGWGSEWTKFDAWNIRQYGFDKVLGSGEGQIIVDLDESSHYGGGGWRTN